MDNIDWGLTAKAIIWIILGCGLYILFALWVGRKLAELGAQYPEVLPRDPMKYEGRDLTPEQRRAVIASDSRWTENEFQQNARRAESLGFIDPADEPRRSA